MHSINTVLLVGSIAVTPAPLSTPGGTTYASFILATERAETRAGRTREVTDYHRVLAWGPFGDTCQKFLARPQVVLVEGELVTRTYEVDGTAQSTTEIDAREVHLLRRTRTRGITIVDIATLALTETSAS